MPARLLLARFLGLTACIALVQGCGGHGSKGTTVAPSPQQPGAEVAADSAAAATEPPADSADVAQPLAQPFRPSAPGEIVSEAAIADRRLVVGDMVRTGLVTTVEQGPPGIVRVGVGERFRTHHSRDYHFSHLASAYYTWAVDDQPLVVELWEGRSKIGEYVDRRFRMGADSTAVGGTGEQIPPVATSRGQGPVESAQPANGWARSKVHVGLGLGGGVMDLPCRGCESAAKTGFSGFLSLAGLVGTRTLVGIETPGWTKSESGSTPQVYSVTAQVTEYASATSGLFLSAGVGLVGYREDAERGDLSASAAGFSGRLGYEIGAGRVAFVPYVGLVRTFGGADMKLDGQNARLNVAISNLQFGLSIATR
jgi:hypothetical protein